VRTEAATRVDRLDEAQAGGWQSASSVPVRRLAGRGRPAVGRLLRLRVRPAADRAA